MQRRVVCGASALVLSALVLATCGRDDDRGGTSPIAVAAVAVSPESDTLVVGGTRQLTATPQDRSGTPLPDRPVAWSSSRPAVASVSETGLVTAVSPGLATIEAESESRTGEAQITVLPPSAVEHVTVAPAADTLVVRDTVRLVATVTDASNNVLDAPVTWETDRPEVATVDGDGLVTAVATGAATVSAVSEGKRGSAQLTVTPPAVAYRMGRWTAPFPWPIVAVHLHLLPTGKLLSWGKKGQPHLWDPATGAFAARPVGHNLFCAGHSFLPDGRLLVSGGHIQDGVGLNTSYIFDPATESWIRQPDMRHGRWYPTHVTLPNGEVISHSGEERYREVPTPEVWRPGSGWRLLTGASRVHIYYPRMFLAPDGRVFYAGEEQETSYLDPSGNGSWSFVANRQFNRLRSYGSAVMYEPGKILYAGGGLNPPTNTAEVIDLNQAAPRWRYTSPMAFARRQMNATLLADGTVLVTGGTSANNFNNPAGAARAAELWNPATEQWRTLASNQVIRMYHSTSILLPDGRVLHTGSGDAGVYDGTGPAPDQRNAELFSPPYLFNPDGTDATRPTIANAPANIGYGETFSVETPDAASITRVTFIRLGSVTHAFDQNQRLVRLPFTQAAGGISVTAPSNVNAAPPGHYLLFILNDRGVPSVAKIVHIG